jgi:putative nucleotidyltransferase with HDIG domain
VPLTRTANATPRAQPDLVAIAAQHPEQRVAVIVQKLARDASVERTAARLGALVTTDLHIINAFAAEMPAGAAIELARAAGVRWISLDAPVVRATACAPCVDGTNLKNAYIRSIGADRVWNEAPYYQGDVPHSSKLEHMAPGDSKPAEYAAAFATGLPAKQPAPARAPTPAADLRTEAAQPQSSGRDGSQSLLWLFVGAVIATGIAITLLGVAGQPHIDPVVLGLLVIAAFAAELFEVNVYGDNTVSVSVAIAFAAALLAGILGVACVSTTIVAVHNRRRRPALYKTLFNWATHVIAGSVPALVLTVLSLSLETSNLLLLALPIAGAALAYYAIETGLVGTAVSLSTGTNLVTKWREQFSWLAGHYLVLCLLGFFLSLAYLIVGLTGVIVFLLPILMMHVAQKQYVARTTSSMWELRRLNHELTRANQEICGANQAIRQLNDELFLTLARIIDARDPYVGGHATQVAHDAMMIAAKLGLPQERAEHLRQAGLLHDIGKIAISEQILHKPSKLTAEEYIYMQTHAPRGAELLEASGALRHLAPFVRHHHERWDGLGYPDGLRAEQITLEARILAVCDAVEAMASDRPYHRGMSAHEVIEEIRRGTGVQFDPLVAEAFIGIVEREGAQFIVNSANTVERKHAEQISAAPLPSQLP